MSKLALRAQTVDIAYLPLCQDLFAKNVLMTAQRDFHLGNSLFGFDYDVVLMQGHVIVKPNLLIFKLLPGYGYLFFGYAQ